MEKGKPEIIGCRPVFKTGAAAPWACQASPEADVQVHLHGKQARYKSNCRTHHLGRADDELLRSLIEKHAQCTDSARARHILSNWDRYRGKFVKVMPNEYRRALKEMAVRKNQLEAA